jgi:hypothetical protein
VAHRELPEGDVEAAGAHVEEGLEPQLTVALVDLDAVTAATGLDREAHAVADLRDDLLRDLEGEPVDAQR